MTVFGVHLPLKRLWIMAAAVVVTTVVWYLVGERTFFVGTRSHVDQQMPVTPSNSATDFIKDEVKGNTDVKTSLTKFASLDELSRKEEKFLGIGIKA
jgi:hypothetical protein